ncbi:UPF0158 family protein [Clostridium sp. SM-530-WT-3G]|uniref:UPF0158 family protein n=1 Tax=Clostridium sp. SM-530-WT-3G TaxID=2725303 RepID=UPI00145CBAF3|nr:hypothetical protein [Clostridium sp. SM-530-WT-3G]
MKVNLNDVIECIEFENENLNHFYNKKTGIIIYKESSDTSSYSASDYNRINEFEEWERELIESLYDLENNPDDYIKLPGEEDINELKILVNFCNSFSDILIDDILNKNIDDTKKIQKIKKIIEEKNMLNDWYEYREQSERQIAIDWCKDNNIEFEE